MVTIIGIQLKQANILMIRPLLWAWHNGIMRWHWLQVVSDLPMFWIQIMQHMGGRSSIRMSLTILRVLRRSKDKWRRRLRARRTIAPLKSLNVWPSRCKNSFQISSWSRPCSSTDVLLLVQYMGDSMLESKHCNLSLVIRWEVASPSPTLPCQGSTATCLVLNNQ